MSRQNAVDRLLKQFATRRPVRAKSLIVTFFGDVISQHGGTVWLGSLINAMETVGVGERLVRTSVFRLCREDWLESERVGRRSYYRFTQHGNHEYQRAAKRIYSREEQAWVGQWQLLITLAVDENRSARLRRSLEWLGFRSLVSGVFAKPGKVGEALHDVVEEYDLHSQVLLLDADSGSLNAITTIRQVIHDRWNLGETTRSYEQFIASFRPVLEHLLRQERLCEDPVRCFSLRLILVHEYRRLLLIDTALPEELLPPEWPGIAARQLTAELYALLTPASLDYIGAQLEGGNGLLSREPAPSYWQRFAGAR